VDRAGIFAVPFKIYLTSKDHKSTDLCILIGSSPVQAIITGNF
jgi:hypothetical protein